MKKQLFLLLCLLSSGFLVAQPTYQTVISNLGGSQNNAILGVDTDHNGNFYFCGSHSDALQFVFASAPSGNGGAFLGKVDQYGAVYWIRQGGTSLPTNDVAYDVAVDQNNDVYVCGGIPAFAPATFGSTTLPSGNIGFVAKYDDAGNLLWVQGYPASIYAIAINQQNTPVINQGDNSIFKIDPANGNPDWNAYGTLSGNLMNPKFHNIQIDAANNIIVQGGNKIIKFDNSFNTIWSTAVSASLAETHRIYLDNAGNVYGTFYALFGSVTVGTITKSNFPNGYLYKLDAANGQVLLCDSILINGAASKIKAVIPDNNGHYYISGDGAFNTPHLQKITTTYSTVWDVAQPAQAPINDVCVITSDCFYIAGNHSANITLGNFQIALPGSTGENSYMAFVCAGNVGIEEQASANVIAYPNPSDGVFSLQGINAGAILLTDINGKQETIQLTTAGQIDLRNKPNGIYQLMITTFNGERYRCRIVKI